MGGGSRGLVLVKHKNDREKKKEEGSPPSTKASQINRSVCIRIASRRNKKEKRQKKDIYICICI